MNPLELIASLSPEERMDMILKGLRPGDARDIRRYRNGNVASLKEREEQAKNLFGNVRSNLGESHYADRMPTEGDEYEALDVPLGQAMPQKKQTSERDYRQALNEEMNDYARSSSGTSIGMDDILSFKQKAPLQRSNGVSAIYQEGYNNAKNYLNAFVLNLQNGTLKETYNTRLSVFKALKASLEAEQKYKGDNKKLAEYRNGSLAAEKSMLEKLQ